MSTTRDISEEVTRFLERRLRDEVVNRTRLAAERLGREAACPSRRSPHTMPRSGAEEQETQPFLFLALEALAKEQKRLEGLRDASKEGTPESGADIKVSPSDFVAEYLAQNMSTADFHNGNKPRYGPSARNGILQRRPRRNT
ncbi:uncharacterized protein LOC119557120 isoform X2 [Drosophila subpulchrella]|uniref:uncharacterized protein LOC119557120 isoform X2 n=1 Tax=Drosophila subpulchrella TaxID=1486046 RepID=UPI0018A14021|nr:uncharacterized protein LOC119557120 isoform X2 [Drosophila subpulchrella]